MSAQFIAVEPFDLVVFGGTGDLAMRKILPGLYHRHCDGQLPPESRVIGVARSPLAREAYVERANAALRRFIAPTALKEACVEGFLQRLQYLALDAGADSDWAPIVALLAEAPERVRVFYLATAPDLFGPICRRIAGAGVLTPKTRVVLEKPIGHDLPSARAINDEVGAVFDERQIFRIDHYLGKETVQNLMALRFANSLFEPLWSHSAIDHVQITVAETIGVEGRGAYYNGAGALRDMVQNHMLQLLCLVAMEPPSSFTADAVRDEKLKVLRALEPMSNGALATRVARGQYQAGAIDGKAVPGYLEELGRANTSSTETFVALKAQVENWRWAGVPFYMRTGKRMPKRLSEIVVQFKTIPHSIFDEGAGEVRPNRLSIRLQPDEGVTLLLMSKDPGPGGMRLKQVPLNLSFADTFHGPFPDAYERLLLDVVRGNPTLFMRKDEVEAAWTWIEPILDGWGRNPAPPRAYTAGSWGPSDAAALMARDGRSWFEDAA
ncbi:MAG TPA: glucose-6-phosphate dehydrogenase [Methylomirabilota bacterium]|nr:glucose-6-phosphate dehydrogenase [Methylomirabilota bacterium]